MKEELILPPTTKITTGSITELNTTAIRTTTIRTTTTFRTTTTRINTTMKADMCKHIHEDIYPNYDKSDECIHYKDLPNRRYRFNVPYYVCQIKFSKYIGFCLFNIYNMIDGIFISQTDSKALRSLLGYCFQP